MTSRFEGLPMTLLEAKSYKLPIVSFDIKTGPRECVLDEVNGYLVQDENIKLLSDRICDLVEDDKKRINFSQHALDNTEKFDINKIVDEWKMLLNSI